MTDLPPSLEAPGGTAAYQHAYRYLRVGGLSRVFFGLAFTATGFLAGLLILSLTDSLVVGGSVAAAGVVAGLLSSRRGLKVLRALPLVVEGRVEHKATNGKAFLAILQVTRAAHLTPQGEEVPTPERVGKRSLPVTGTVYEGLQEGATVQLLCLPQGLAVARRSDFR